MKGISISCLVLIVCILNTAVCTAQQTIEGLHYFDHAPVSIEIRDGSIVQITRLEALSSGTERVYIAPGLIDNQVNGFAGVTFALGSGDLTPAGVENATRKLWEYGVTTYLPTLTTNSRELFLKNLAILAAAKNDPELFGSIAGFHLEGPYINPEDGYRGAHPKEHVRLPDWDEFVRFQDAAQGHILQITVAPEMEGALDFITRCSRAGIVVALGHHNAPAATVHAAIDRGARIATHIGNGAANMIHRHRNPFWSQLSDDRFHISIICDGFHLLPEEIAVFYKVKGVHRTIITSDVTSFGGLPPGNYSTAEGDPIRITDEGMLMNVAQGGLYGSATAITKGVGHIMRVTGCTLAEAVQMASTNPASLYGLEDRGMLKPGMRADMVLFTLKDQTMHVRETWVEGNRVYKRIGTD
jgi:N-acetylglucosamine-6-phosphate deacetylase